MNVSMLKSIWCMCTAILSHNTAAGYMLICMWAHRVFINMWIIRVPFDCSGWSSMEKHTHTLIFAYYSPFRRPRAICVFCVTAFPSSSAVMGSERRLCPPRTQKTNLDPLVSIWISRLLLSSQGSTSTRKRICAHTRTHTLTAEMYSHTAYCKRGSFLWILTFVIFDEKLKSLSRLGEISTLDSASSVYEN